MSSHQHGYLKPHPSIFEAALRLLDTRADESVMVGDSYAHDIEGARAVGMRGVLVQRSSQQPFRSGVDGVPVIGSLAELVGLL